MGELQAGRSEDASTFPRLLLQHARRQPSGVAWREKNLGVWQSITWARGLDWVRRLACGLAALGLQRGEHVAIVGENRPRLYAVMLAAQTLGAIPAPLYQDAVAAELAYPLELAAMRFAIVEDQEQVDKLLDMRGALPLLDHILFHNPRGLRQNTARGLLSLDEVEALGRQHHALHPDLFEQVVAQGRPEDVAALFFTSGTTGHPKGVVHTHASLIDRARAGAAFDRLTAREDVLAYLPPAWIGQNIFSYAQHLVCGYTVNCPESPSTVAIDLGEIGPTYYFAPPRVFEALLTKVQVRMDDATGFKRWLYRASIALAERVQGARDAGGHPALRDRLLLPLVNALMLAPLRNGLGLSRVRVAYTAGEAIGPELFRFYRGIGINLKQLYGSTETAVFVCMQPDSGARSDSVGLPAPGVELRVSDSGEIVLRSAGLLREYYRNPEATAEVLDADGWYHTGDAGWIEPDGQLRIIDRAKDVSRLADGTLFAPKLIENKLKFYPAIKEAVAFGAERAHVVALLNIDFAAVGNWAEKRALPYSGYADLAAKPEVLALLADCVARVNADLAADPHTAGVQVHRFAVLHKELDPDDEELTRTRKVRRRFVAQKYAALVAALYDPSRQQQHIHVQVRFDDGRTGSVQADLPLVDATVHPALRQAA
uniref:Putative long-chain-fatty-acid--CoA ligase n=1 Tax=mine drainage metagenome TaxID=410659 RepID=E6PNQ5_9ZZZZ